MNSNWFGKLTTSALALTVGTGMLLLSGCNDNNNCDNCGDKAVETSCCDEVAPIETSYEPTVKSDRTDAARRDVDTYDNNAAQAAPARDASVQAQAPAAPAAPAPDVNAPAPAAPAAPAPTAQAPAPAPDVNAPAAKSEADKNINVSVNNEINNAPAQAPDTTAAADLNKNAPAADVRGDGDKHSGAASFAADMQGLGFFLGSWNAEQHMTKDDGSGKDSTGTMNFKSSADGHALVGDLSMKGDKGTYEAHMVIAANRDTAMKASIDAGFAKQNDAAFADNSKANEQALPTSADNKDVKATDTSNKNQFVVFFTDSKGHSALSKQAYLDGDSKFHDVFEFTDNGKTMTKNCDFTKESNDKITFTMDKDDGTGMTRHATGTMTRAK